jgi:hypothetical protein
MLNQDLVYHLYSYPMKIHDSLKQYKIKNMKLKLKLHIPCVAQTVKESPQATLTTWCSVSEPPITLIP